MLEYVPWLEQDVSEYGSQQQQEPCQGGRVAAICQQ